MGVRIGRLGPQAAGRSVAACIALGLLTACGSPSARPADPTVARVGAVTISRAYLQQYVDYSLRFYRLFTGNQTVLAVRGCPATASDQPCTVYRRQALRRLIEEQLVLSYARQHGIAIRSRGHRAIAARLGSMSDPQGSTPSTLSRLGVSRAFMQGLLEREALVQRVAHAVAPPWTRSGPTFEVRKVAVFFGGSASRSAAYKRADTLAVDGGPVPATAVAQVEWVAPFRLPAAELQALQAARPGEYTGPFPHSHSFLDVQLLAKRVHSYGTPARRELEAEYLRSWLRREWSRARPACLGTAGARVPCP